MLWMSMWLNSSFLQFRSAATVSTICVILLVVLSSALVHAADLVPSTSEIQNNLTLGDSDGQFSLALGSYNGLVIEDGVDESGETRGLDLVRRAPEGASALGNNQYKPGTIKLGETQWWYFPKDAVDGKTTNETAGGKRSDNSKRSTTVYLSLTMCSKPDSKDSSAASSPLPQLEVYVSLSESLQKPGPGKDDSSQNKTQAEGGYMSTTVEAQGDVYIGVAAPNSTHYSGSYEYEIAASINGLYHEVDVDDSFLHFVDADRNNALLTTRNLTDSPQETSKWMDTKSPYTMFASNTNDTAITGLQRSYCALDRFAQLGKGDHEIEASMTDRGLDKRPKAQFYVTGLNRSSTYTGILAMDGNSTDSGNGIVRGGGKIWKPFNFSTKADDNCAVVYDLPFCSDVAYAVPSNPSMKAADLRSTYDDYAAAVYKNFTYSLDQIQCDAPNETRFSLAVGCDDCADAYKQWLCAVTIPRCTDYSSKEDYYHVRNAGQDFLNGTSISADDSLRKSPATNQSRNSLIDSKIRPGPYKEILPCQDVCYNLVKRCPAALGFSCPDGRWAGSSYGTRDPDGGFTCNSLNGGNRLFETPGASLYALAIASALVLIF